MTLQQLNTSDLRAGGAIVWNSELGAKGTNTPSAWTNIFDVRSALGGNAFAQVTALDAITIGNTQYVAAAWCGPCNVSFGSGSGFHSGIVMLKNSGNGWTSTSQACTGATTTCPA